MRGQLAENRQVLEARFEVTDVRLVLDDRNAVDIGERILCVDGLADTAL